jgi:hypothetical protein
VKKGTFHSFFQVDKNDAVGLGPSGHLGQYFASPLIDCQARELLEPPTYSVGGQSLVCLTRLEHIKFKNVLHFGEGRGRAYASRSRLWFQARICLLSALKEAHVTNLRQLQFSCVASWKSHHLYQNEGHLRVPFGPLELIANSEFVAYICRTNPPMWNPFLII